MKDRRVKDFTKIFVIAMVLAVCMGCPVMATEVTNSINKLYSLISSIVVAIGAIVLLWGVFDFATAWQDHNTPQMTAGVKKIVSGLLMVGASGIITYIQGA